MKAKIKKSGSNGFTINLNCEHCGKSINRTSVHFGMDCEDGCAEKKYNQRLSGSMDKIQMDDLVKMFM